MSNSANFDLPEFKKIDKKQQEVTLDEALELAQGHHSKGNFVLAERTYRDILAALPDHFPTTHLLGVLLFQTQNFQEAKKYMKLALDSEPENISCLNNYGGVLAQLGNHEEALEYYERALNINPEHKETLDNKALALFRLNRFKEALTITQQTLDLGYNDLITLNNHAMILARLSRYEDALEAWEKALENGPEAMILSNMGNALREMERFGQAIEKCNQALEIKPDFPEALNNLANVYRDKGEPAKAIEYYKKATELSPGYLEAHYNMALAQCDMKKYKDAIASAKYALALKNDFVEAYAPLVSALCEEGEFEQAHKYARQAVHLGPQKHEPYLMLAEVLSQYDNYDDAEAVIAQALKYEPESARAYITLSNIREKADDPHGAIEAIEKGLQVSPNYMPLLMNRAKVYLYNDNPQKALEHMDAALELFPDNYGAMVQKAESLISLNRNDEARELLKSAIQINEDMPSAYASYFSITPPESESEPLFIKMKSLEEEIEKYGKQAASNFYFSLSDAYEALKDFDAAFFYLEKANDIRRSLIPTERLTNQWTADKIAASFYPEYLESLKEDVCPSDVPVFIVGMPRSGTTLTEQIISSHPDVYGGGELRVWGQVMGKATEINAETLIYAGNEYVQRIKQLDKSGKAKRITDKMPGNFNYVGIIKAALPNAKIIHCRRNPLDTCLSCYQQNFMSLSFSFDQNDIADEYERYLEVMDYWRSILPEDSFLEIDYEETVNNFEEQARKLIDFVGLEWDDACLEPHKQNRAVLTASKAQVTKPIYKSSVEKWRRYEKHLQPLVRRLLPDQALPEEETEAA